MLSTVPQTTARPVPPEPMEPQLNSQESSTPCCRQISTSLGLYPPPPCRTTACPRWHALSRAFDSSDEAAKLGRPPFGPSPTFTKSDRTLPTYVTLNHVRRHTNDRDQHPLLLHQAPDTRARVRLHVPTNGHEQTPACPLVEQFLPPRLVAPTERKPVRRMDTWQG